MRIDRCQATAADRTMSIAAAGWMPRPTTTAAASASEPATMTPVSEVRRPSGSGARVRLPESSHLHPRASPGSYSDGSTDAPASAERARRTRAAKVPLRVVVAAPRLPGTEPSVERPRVAGDWLGSLIDCTGSWLRPAPGRVVEAGWLPVTTAEASGSSVDASPGSEHGRTFRVERRCPA